MAAMVLNEEDKDPTFYVDLRATTHVTNNPSKMSQVTPHKGNDEIYVRNGDALRISHIDEVKLKTNYRDLKL